jgi:hypothetical protein
MSGSRARVSHASACSTLPMGCLNFSEALAQQALMVCRGCYTSYILYTIMSKLSIFTISLCATWLTIAQPGYSVRSSPAEGRHLLQTGLPAAGSITPDPSSANASLTMVQSAPPVNGDPAATGEAGLNVLPEPTLASKICPVPFTRGMLPHVLKETFH